MLITSPSADCLLRFRGGEGASESLLESDVAGDTASGDVSGETESGDVGGEIGLTGEDISSSAPDIMNQR